MLFEEELYFSEANSPLLTSLIALITRLAVWKIQAAELGQ